MYRILWLGLVHRVPQLRVLIAGGQQASADSLLTASLGCIARMCTPAAVLGGTQLDLEKVEAGGHYFVQADATP